MLINNLGSVCYSIAKGTASVIAKPIHGWVSGYTSWFGGDLVPIDNLEDSLELQEKDEYEQLSQLVKSLEDDNNALFEKFFNDDKALFCYMIQDPERLVGLPYAVRDNACYFNKFTREYEQLTQKDQSYKEQKKRWEQAYENGQINKQSYDEIVEGLKKSLKDIDPKVLDKRKADGVSHADLYIKKLKLFYQRIGLEDIEIPASPLTQDGIIQPIIAEKIKEHVLSRDNYRNFIKFIKQTPFSQA